ncbi:MAG: RNA polymerase sigma factor, partial [Pirellula sp.]|nr:RNA polymerase sigma factor [Pirellula sp.]
MSEMAKVVQKRIDEIYRSESRRVFATLVRLLQDFDLAEESLHEAFTHAVQSWTKDGIPENPRAWLVSTGRFKAIDALRRKGRLNHLKESIVNRMGNVAQANMAKASEEIEDDRLRLIFTCCHPAIDPKVQVPLTLREVCGLTTEEISSAFLVSPTTMAQRIVRGKVKIRDAGIPFDIPESPELQERLGAVLAVIYLVFNEGYSASSGSALTRSDLSGEAIRLGRLLVELLPDSEAMGLLALMLLQESRRQARTDENGDLVLLEDQDRKQWDSSLIEEGVKLVDAAFATGRISSYTLQAAIASVHARATASSETDWRRIVVLYDALLSIHATSIVELNRAVAVAMRDGPEHGLLLIDQILSRGELNNYHLAHAARADLCRRIGRKE